MTRDEAIKGLTSLVEVRRKYVGMQTMKDEIECLEMAIKTLEQEPCDDAISRQAVLNILDDVVKDYIKENDFDKAQGVAWVKVQKLPPVTPKPKIGRWIDKDGISDFMYCSNCGGKKHYSEKWIGCPYCLADMRESYKEESEDK